MVENRLYHECDKSGGMDCRGLGVVETTWALLTVKALNNDYCVANVLMYYLYTADVVALY